MIRRKHTPLRPLRGWLNATPLRRWSTALASLTIVALGVALTIRAVLPPSAPPTDAPQEELIAFLKSNADRVSSSQRDRLLDELARRYIAATPDQRRAFEEQWRAAGFDRATRRQIEAHLDFALACNLADAYRGLPPDQRGPFLDRVLVMINAMGGGREFLHWLGQNPARDVFTDPAGAASDLAPYQKKLIYGTTAEQRTSLSHFGGELAARAKRYRE